MADPPYGLWPQAILNTAPFRTLRDQLLPPAHPPGLAAMGGFTAFLVALFTETYGVPLTIYLDERSAGIGEGVTAVDQRRG